MPTPDSPSLDYSFTAFQEAQGNNTFPGTQLDAALTNLKKAIDDIIGFTGAVIRDDEKLNNGVVTKESLDADVLLGLPTPRPWVTAKAYAADDTATTNNGLYLCLVAHTSNVFATDLAAGRWVLLAAWTPLTEVTDGSISTPKLADLAVTAAKLAANSVLATKVPDGELPLSKLTPAAQSVFTPVGAEMDFSGPFAPAGWLFKAGQALSRVTYSALFGVLCPALIGNVANASTTVSGLVVDLRGLGLEGSKIEGPSIPAGATVVSVTETSLTLSANAGSTVSSAQIRIFPHGNGDGSTTFTLPDDRGRGSIGRDNMGGTAASRVTNSGAGNPALDAAKLGATGGVDRHILTAAQTPQLSGETSSDGAHQHEYQDAGGSSANRGAVEPAFTSTSVPGDTTRATAVAGNHGHSVTVNSTGGGAHPNVQPSRVVNKIIYAGVL